MLFKLIIVETNFRSLVIISFKSCVDNLIGYFLIFFFSRFLACRGILSATLFENTDILLDLEFKHIIVSNTNRS